MSNEVMIEGHSKMIETIDIDPIGNRMISGGLDFMLKLWDFSGMNKRLRSMREFKPFDGHPVKSISFDPSGENFLCCCTSSSAKIMTREGQKVQ